METEDIAQRRLIASRANDLAAMMRHSGMDIDKITILALGLLFIVQMRHMGISEIDLAVILGDFWHNGGEITGEKERVN